MTIAGFGPQRGETEGIKAAFGDEGCVMEGEGKGGGAGV